MLSAPQSTQFSFFGPQTLAVVAGPLADGPVAQPPQSHVVAVGSNATGSEPAQSQDRAQTDADVHLHGNREECPGGVVSSMAVSGHNPNDDGGVGELDSSIRSELRAAEEPRAHAQPFACSVAERGGLRMAREVRHIVVYLVCLHLHASFCVHLHASVSKPAAMLSLQEFHQDLKSAQTTCATALPAIHLANPTKIRDVLPRSPNIAGRVGSRGTGRSCHGCGDLGRPRLGPNQHTWASARVKLRVWAPIGVEAYVRPAFPAPRPLPA